MIIDADDTTGTWNGRHYYKFLLRDTPPIEPIEVAIRLREIINERPDTCAMINLSNYMTEDEIHTLDEEMVYFVGSWPNPTTARQLYTKIINPNYRHSIHKYSDVIVRCKCGKAKVQTTRSCHANMEVERHEDDCPIYDKQETNSKINKKRASLLRTLARLNFHSSAAIPRFGLERDSIDTRWAEAMDIDLNWERANGTRLASNTMAHLIFDYSPEKIGRAFGLSDDEVKRKVRENTGVDPYRAYKQRRWG